ncbi:hypothetical protein GCM10007276_12140 [Agaricicola taiwanensis]|uniref:SF4 helicase domain-containing protein n=1 Tax=Agaricicola taiwanensis TaxID=591372 RepID=A0A8J2VQZ7_9RHOB|nr:toprim domain-containing protein [Agaricicola taiwanensis]GGE36235.1 hypothetical protein GCM10007276_12140 [Agaricicola taiwanensis]
MADITEIKRRLADRAQAVAEMLLPNGRKNGPEWECGSVNGEKGQSLKVHLSGTKAGVWSDFSASQGGDLLDLWCATRGMTLPQALDAARDWLGISRPEPYRQPDRAYVRPEKPKCERLSDGHVLDYLTITRDIPAAILAAYKVSQRGNEIIFPFLLPDGVLALAKARKAEDGAKPMPTARDCEPILFGWQAIPDTAREVVICEGEIDALSWAAYGYPAMSVPFGGGKGAKQQWIENDFDRLARFERIYISTDMDQPGEDAAEEIASRLGRHRCVRVHLPHKDINKCRTEGVTAEGIKHCIETASTLDPEGLRNASHFTDQVIHLFWPAPEDHVGYATPYRKLEGKLLFRPAEVTLWSGSSGAGKSQILSHCIVDFVAQGSRVCLSSLEMRADQLLKRMVKQAVGVDRPTAPYIRSSLRWLDQGLLIYERVGKSGVEGLLEVFDYARAKYGCDQFVIDSLMRLGIAGDDYTGQEKAMFAIVDWAIRHNVHVHLVAHSRKGEKDRGGAPETEDIKGAMEIGANAFNIVTVWRDRKREEALGKAQSEDERKEIEEKPGVMMNIAKQRNGDFEGKIGLWFDQASYRYASGPDRGIWPKKYIPDADTQAA